MEIFRLQNLSGLFLTSRKVIKKNYKNEDKDGQNEEHHELFLEKEDFSENQIWYLSHDRLFCGNGYKLSFKPESYYGRLISEFFFHHIEDDKFYIGEHMEPNKETNFFNLEEHMEPSILPIVGMVSPFIWRKVVSDPSYDWATMNTDQLPENSFPAGKEHSKDEAGKEHPKDEAGKEHSKDEAGKEHSKDEAGKEHSKDEAQASSNDLNVYVGRCLLEGDIHIGKVRDGNRYVGFHDEDEMGVETFYLQSESGLYLTNQGDDTLTLEELKFSPTQIWYWDYSYDFKKDCRGRNKNMLKCGNGRFLQMKEDTPETCVIAGHTPKEKLRTMTEELEKSIGYSFHAIYGRHFDWDGFNVGGDGPDDTKHLFYGRELEDGTIMIGRFADKDLLDLNDQTYFGFSKTEDGLPMMKTTAMNDRQINKWRIVPTNQNYKWVTMDTEELPQNILPIWKEGQDGCDDIYMCRAQVNGKIHPGNIIRGRRHIGRIFHYWDFFEVCQSMSKFVDVCNHCYDLKSRKYVTPDFKHEKYSALCLEPGATVEWLKMPDLKREDKDECEDEDENKDESENKDKDKAECDLSMIPKGAVIAGVVSGHIYYVGRGNVYGERKFPGIFNPKDKNAKLEALDNNNDYIDLKQFNTFEILVVKKEDGEQLRTKIEKIPNETRYFGLDNVERRVTIEPFSVLRADPEAEFDWVEYEDGKLPNGAVIAGLQDYGINPTGVFYVGRGIIKSHTPPFQDIIIPGIFLHKKPQWKERTGMEEHTLYGLSDGKVLQLENFQALVVTKHSPIIKKVGKPSETKEGSCRTQEADSSEKPELMAGLSKLPKHVFTLGDSEHMVNVVMTKDNRFIYTLGEFYEERGLRRRTYTLVREKFIKIWDMNRPPDAFSSKAQEYATHHMQIKFLDMESVGKMTISQDKSTLAVSGTEKVKDTTIPIVQVLDLSGTYPKFKTPLKRLIHECVSLSLSPDGRLCYICQGKDRAVRVFDLHNDSCVGIFCGHTSAATCIDLSHDGTKLWSGGEDKTARMWDIRSFGQLRQDDLDFEPSVLASSPSGDWAAVKSKNYCTPDNRDPDAPNKCDVIILNASTPDKYTVGGSLDVEGVVSNVKASNSGKWLLTSGREMVGFAAPSGPRIFQGESEPPGGCTISDDDTHIVMNNKVYKI